MLNSEVNWMVTKTKGIDFFTIQKRKLVCRLVMICEDLNMQFYNLYFKINSKAEHIVRTKNLVNVKRARVFHIPYQ